MPSAAAIARSSGRRDEARARGRRWRRRRRVRTVTVALSSRGYCRTLSVRIGLEAGDDDDQVDDDGEDRPPDEDVGELHGAGPQRFSGCGRELGLRLHVVVHDDGRAVAELEGAGDDHVLPGGHPVVHGHEVAPRVAEDRTNCCRATFSGAAVGPLTGSPPSSLLSSTRKSESPYDACTSAVAGTMTTSPRSGRTTATLDEHARGAAASPSLGTVARTLSVRVVASMAGSMARTLPSSVIWVLALDVDADGHAELHELDVLLRGRRSPRRRVSWPRAT